jgi:hypothetical protein
MAKHMGNPALPDADALALVEKYHAGHPRADQVEHCIRVARRAAELPWGGAALSLQRSVVLAALGHDLYEDSDVTRTEIIQKFGAAVDHFIGEVTEPEEGVPAFVQSVLQSSEEAQIIKLCDGADNYESLVETGLLHQDPLYWRGVVSGQMEPMFDALEDVKFYRHPAAGQEAQAQLDDARTKYQRALDSLT